jgi:hypothetical protein
MSSIAAVPMDNNAPQKVVARRNPEVNRRAVPRFIFQWGSLKPGQHLHQVCVPQVLFSPPSIRHYATRQRQIL